MRVFDQAPCSTACTGSGLDRNGTHAEMSISLSAPGGYSYAYKIALLAASSGVSNRRTAAFRIALCPRGFFGSFARATAVLLAIRDLVGFSAGDASMMRI